MRIIEPFEQFFDGDGDPLINGWLKFTESGTNLTDKDTYADVNLSIKNTNPLQLDSEGRCPDVFGNGSYRVTLYMDDGAGAPGIQIDQKDPVSGGGSDKLILPFWSVSTEYGINELVIYGDNYYISRTVDNVGNIPSSSYTNWEQVDFTHFYNSDITYDINAWVIDATDSKWYQSLVVDNLGKTPSSNPTEWRGGTVLLADNNLSDISSTSTSRTNLDVYSKSETDSEILAVFDGIIPVGSLIEYYGGLNPNSLFFAETGDTIDSSVYLLIKPVINPDLTFTSRTAAGSYSGTLRGVSYGNNVWVIVGDTGEIQTSPDGITWTQRTAAGSYSGTFEAVFWDGSQFIIVGSTGEIQTSPDGITWTQRTAAGSYSGTFADISGDGSIIVAVGTGGEIQTSPDGITWTQRTAAGSYSGTLRGVSYGNSLWVIVGDTGEIQSSPDGITWTQRTAAGSYSGTFYSIAYGNSIFVATGGSGEIQSSPDGITWTQNLTSKSYDILNILFGDGIFLFSGTSIVGTTVDAINLATQPPLTNAYAGFIKDQTCVIVGALALIETTDTTDRLIPTFSTSQTGFTQYIKIA